MKPLKKVGKSEPKGWEQPDTSQHHFPIIPEPVDDNELPVPYYDSDEHNETSDDEGSTWNYESDYTSDSSVDTTRRVAGCLDWCDCDGSTQSQRNQPALTDADVA